MSEIELAVVDSLNRQIKEVKRQIDQIKNRNMSKFLEIRRKTDQRKARLVLITLKLKKQLHDCQHFLEDSRKQWTSELSHSYDSILVIPTQNYVNFLQIREALQTVPPHPVSLGPFLRFFFFLSGPRPQRGRGVPGELQ